ncbi:PREDICTED: uncharacterized protein LOC105451677 [Wasmannia auropunctata]|uniref:uncharacterized protein LOC105451677 n=1 Tax=Wasmannia auropunctata TaxID=64793 RepID=UPI0005EE3A83|nr:PREDICTED: uncharacterized protein LOC105451677 [Wasmannia auropunctata]
MKILQDDLLLYVLISLLSGNVANAQNQDDAQNSNAIDRLSTNVKPISYSILLIPNLQDNICRGNSKITVVIQEHATNNITLHVGSLIEIKTVNISVLVPNYGNLPRNFSTSYDNITEMYTISTSETFAKDDHIEITFVWRGIMLDDKNMVGFYRSSYFDDNGQIKWLAVTQFGMTYARHAFPCFDEPSFKAKFNISIVRDDNYRSLSNMPLTLTRELIDFKDKSCDIFDQSIPIPTYLVTFVISEFDFRNSTSSGGIQFKVWSKPSTINQTQYALKIGTTAIELFNKKFNEIYILPKMDIVAVPDFGNSAMENWGLTTYRESFVLYDGKESSATAQQMVTSTIVHELAHQWFGNLVTPKWWSYFWLSEAFATYFEYFATAEIKTTWNMKEQFVVQQHQPALIADSFCDSLPMTRVISRKLLNILDMITYSKGASIVRMMNLIFGTKIFEDGLRSYIQNNKVKGLGHPDVLWKAINDQVIKSVDPRLKSIDVKTIMDTWTTKAGYPVVTIVINDNGVILPLYQNRFLLTNFTCESPTNHTWTIPLTFTTQSKPDFDNTIPKYWMSTERYNIRVKVDPKEWVIFNLQSSGFYRVNYNNRGWQNIFNSLKNGNLDDIHVLNRASIVDDLLNLGRAGYQNYAMVLDGLLYLKRETNYLPFKAAFNGFEYLNMRFTGHEEHSYFKLYVLSLIDNIHMQLRYEDKENDDRLTILLRQEVNNWLCKFDDNECVTIYKEKFKQWRTNATARIMPNERTIAYCIAMRYGTSEDWDFLWKEYLNSNYPSDQMVILEALGCSQNTTILEKYLLYAITNYETNRIRRQDSVIVFDAVCKGANSNLLGVNFVLSFVEIYHKKIENYHDEGIIAFLSQASKYLSTVELVNKFEELIDSRKVDFKQSIRTVLKRSLKIAQFELVWYNFYARSIIQWLRAPHFKPAFRLPTNIKPKRYVISITPYLEGNFTFDGKVRISADIVQPTSLIILHSSKLEHRKVNVTADRKRVNILKKKIVNEYDFYVIYLEKKLRAKTKLIIEIEYTGHLNATEHYGFYKSSYVNDKGETRWLATSKFEPTNARKMFPCFDEPAMKAIFDIHVIVPSNYEAISNMEQSTKKNLGGRVMYHFKESVLMSTYLVALIVSDFKSISVQTNRTRFAVFARPNAINQARYALSVMSPLVNFFENTYKQEYPHSQLLMAAIPDFPSGAMENWGLITYRETLMLFDKNHSPITSKKNIRSVIAHEIAHQWFGNLVSPLWWKYLWLNEGFARYFQYHAPARAFNDMALESQFVVEQVHLALIADSSQFTHPISRDVTTPSEIQSNFDTITYSKGGSLLRMIEKVYGIDVFNDALTDYLNKWKYSVATPEDLYASFQLKLNEKGYQTLKHNVKVYLDTWTTQPGYPVINVAVTENFIVIEQKRFFLKQLNKSDNTIWHIPITWASVENKSEFFNTTPIFWMTERKIRRRKLSDLSLLIFNTQQSGYYRVNYDKKNWIQLIDYLKNENFETIHEINRAALIDDLMNLARAAYVDYEIAISAIMYLEKENNYLPWRAFFNNLLYLNNRFRGSEMEDIYKKWITFLIGRIYAQLGFEDTPSDNDQIRIFRIHTRRWACKYIDISHCKVYALRYFQKFQHSKIIPPNYRDVVYCTAMRLDMTRTTYNFLWKEYLNSNVVTDKLVILNSLACSENKDVLETLLRDAIAENSSIRYQDCGSVFQSIYSASLIGVEVVIKVIETYYDDILHRHFNNYSKISSLVKALALRLSTVELFNQYKKLLDWLVNKEPKFKKNIKFYLKIAEHEIYWYRGRVSEIIEALNNQFLNTYQKYKYLPKTLYPKLYNVHLTPYMEKGVFEGKVEIYMTVRENTTLIALNSHKLDILNITVFRNGAEIKLQNYTEHIPQQLRIYLSNYVYTNEEIMVEIHFNGTLNDDLNGFYRSSYFDNNTTHHWLAATQFQPMYARQVFPCFDEPAFKSNFTINIQRMIYYNSLSNMPLKTKTTISNNNIYVLDTFHTSNAMPTYLIAFVVSEFKPVNNLESGTFNIWGRPEIATYGQYAQDIGTQLINELQKIMMINYALPKLDLIGIPDFFLGAMENWGLATLDEYELFYNKETITSSCEKSIITIIAKELTHMWFGNLICDWSDYVWLNKGFMQYFQWFTSDRIRPDFKFMDQFVVYELHPALSKVAPILSHTMTYPVEIPKEKIVFDYATYDERSACILRMIFNAFDQEAHIWAFGNLTKQMYYRTVRPADLWRSFESFVSTPIKNTGIERIMNTWINQSGYPVVNATVNNDVLTLTQERFLINRNISGNEIYWIPIDIFGPFNIFTNVSSMCKIWLSSKPERMYINLNRTNNWFLVNYKQTGFYRVNYDTSSWKALINKLNDKGFEDINVLNRAQIIDDLFNLAHANYVDYELLMNASKYLRQETNHLPWKAFFNGLSYIHERLDQHFFQKELNEYVLDLLSEIYDNIGFDDRENDEHLDKLNREMILQWTCKLNKPECIKKSVDLFAAWRKNTSER